MCLGHVYIVLKPVWSARLTFDDDLHYELSNLMTKFVRSLGLDHGHDEESRNGRDVKIDILDDYVRTPEWFRGVSDIDRSTGGLLEPPGELMGLNGPWRERAGGSQVGGARPQAQSALVRGPAPLLVQFGLGARGCAAALGRPSSSTLGSNRPISLPGGFR